MLFPQHLIHSLGIHILRQNAREPEIGCFFAQTDDGGTEAGVFFEAEVGEGGGEEGEERGDFGGGEGEGGVVEGHYYLVLWWGMGVCV